ncbi:hypothetical protein KP509_10G058400 [Ceratopteris richardii]|uniref:SOSEKI DIX-like domain-containing protein n=1 Tax=Ceratopteris richardii TaxID=49495 RepID=A0A8T2TZQ6_CERRI|nr:hypothetical protein KP509_10G058400 [Ceratopteris richardii]
MDYKTSSPSAKVLMPHDRITCLYKKVHVIYYLSYKGGLLEQPHLLDVFFSISKGLRLKDVKARLVMLRGSAVGSSFSWSYKRSFKGGFVWQDLESDTDIIFPTQGGYAYVMKGCRIESSTEFLFPSPSKVVCSSLIRQPSTSRADHPPHTLNSIDIKKHASKCTNGNISDSSLAHGCDEHISLSLGLKGFEQLSSKGSDLHKRNPESQVFTPLSKCCSARFDNKKHVQNHKSNVSKLHCKQPILDAEQYVSPIFSVVKKTARIPEDFNGYVGADVATQTGEEDERFDVAGTHCNDKVLGSLNPHHTEKPLSSGGGEMSVKYKVFIEDAMVELSREDISPPPCSTPSPTSTLTHSSSDSCSNANSSYRSAVQDSVSHSDFSMGHQGMKGIEFVSSSSACMDNEAGIKHVRVAVNSTSHGKSYREKIPSVSAGIEPTSSNMPENLGKNSGFFLSTSKTASHVMSNNSNKFYYLLPCGGLEVIDPIAVGIQRSSSVNSICGPREARKENSSDRLYPKGDSISSLDVPHVSENATSELTELDMKLCVPINTDVKLLEFTLQDGNRSKKPWHWRSWFNSQFERRSMKFRSQ